MNIDAAYEALFGETPQSKNRANLFRSLLRGIESLEEQSTGDLKIADTALHEMADAFAMFRPYRHVRKVTMFGSARTKPADPVYVLARDLAADLATHDWMTVTGAGPGIMAAGTEGAGTEHAIGVNIRLPFEQEANPFISQDPKLVHMRYFFTRKLMLIKESDGYAVLPGGFGTLDECFELLTLIQTGKAEPAPVVLMETPSGSYWRSWAHFVEKEAGGGGMISPGDTCLYKIVDTVEEASKEILGFYANYHSSRWVGDLLVLRLQRSPTKGELAKINADFGDIVVEGKIRSATAFPPERDDHPDLPRLALRFDKFGYARLRQLIDTLNTF